MTVLRAAYSLVAVTVATILLLLFLGAISAAVIVLGKDALP